ncbi:LpxI family protein [Oceaniglobus indicus]|uniref:LpxI family protein n=1 Tax=Oceaniglobus indicus TaxID=2047749 RepID=UPI000C18C113|nr:UDP-2,3-diacylglucosamine diphosphatase LpxI [Oceaniglobus indicus]
MTLALIAGEGDLPGLLLAELETRAMPVILAALDDVRVENSRGRDILRFRLETLGSFLKTLRERDVTQVCFAGAIRRPPVDPGAIDAATMPVVPRMMTALAQGDDAAFNVVVDIFEDAEFEVVGAVDLLPGVLPPAGMLGRHAADDGARVDAARGAAVVAALGQADIGQACVVSAGQVLAVETTPGTEWMLGTIRAARDGLPDIAWGAQAGDTMSVGSSVGRAVGFLAARGAAGPLYVESLPPGGLLFKAPKPGQERRIDLPAIGPDTIAQCVSAGLRGVVVEAGGVMVLNADQVREQADAEGVFVWIRPAD